MIIITFYQCKKCNHKWQPRKKSKPKTCPQCKSAYWEKPTKKIRKDFVIETKKHLIELHDLIISNSGGLNGIRDEGGIYNSSYKILQKSIKYDKEPTKLGAFIFQELAQRHHFNDGNKRTAYCFVKVNLISKGYHLKLDYSNAVEFIIKVADHDNPKTVKEIEGWIATHIKKIPDNEKIDRYLKELYFDIDYKEGNI